MKVKELYRELESIISKGGEEAEIYFDTEASEFDVHCVKIKDIYYEDEFQDYPMVTLHCASEEYNHCRRLSDNDLDEIAKRMIKIFLETPIKRDKS